MPAFRFHAIELGFSQTQQERFH